MTSAVAAQKPQARALPLPSPDCWAVTTVVHSSLASATVRSAEWLLDQNDLGDLCWHPFENVGQVVYFVQGGDHDTDAGDREDPVCDEAALWEEVAGDVNLDVPRW